MWWIYNLATHVLEYALRIYGIFNGRIKQWNRDRDYHLNNISNLTSKINGRRVIWMHCASLGEYEQGLPVLARLKEVYSDSFFLLTFFSPSGYLQKKNAPIADMVMYLPIDTGVNVRKLVDNIKPAIFIGVKYEFWYNLLKTLHNEKCKVIYISVLLKSGDYLLKYGIRDIWQYIDLVFTQDEVSSELLEEGKYCHTIVAGDTRIDNVIKRRQDIKSIPKISAIIGNKNVIVYGSIYLSDLSILKKTLTKQDFIHIIVPHKIEDKNLSAIEEKLGLTAIRYSAIDGPSSTNIVIIDNVGMLFDIYQYAHMVYIGGGFEKNIHSILEPSVYLMPVAFGPKNEGFMEVEYFKKHGIGMEVNSEQQFEEFVRRSCDERYRSENAKKLEEFFGKHRGAAEKVVEALNLN